MQTQRVSTSFCDKFRPTPVALTVSRRTLLPAGDLIADTYAIGRTLFGVQSFDYRGRHDPAWHHMVIHPDETHDGRQRRLHRMIYVEPALIQRSSVASRCRLSPAACPPTHGCGASEVLLQSLIFADRPGCKSKTQ